MWTFPSGDGSCGTRLYLRSLKLAAEARSDWNSDQVTGTLKSTVDLNVT
ncbi:hypothetical protein GGE07_001319 [Sinorhizobium terangae]|nr:hypothetical protein [Sinorhizobium terangae]